MKKLCITFGICLSFFISGSTFAQSTKDCFLADLTPKYTSIPSFVDVTKTSATATVTITMFSNDTIAPISMYLYGNNCNTYMTDMTDPTLRRYISLLSPNIIRYPGGNLSDVFFWDATQKPSDVPDSMYYSGKLTPEGYWFGMNASDWTLSVDNYYSMLNSTGNIGMITVNYGYARYGTSSDPVATAAHYAANWVRYDAGQTKFWEIGNEGFGSWQAGYQINTAKNKDGQPAIQTGDLYGKHFLVFADSMRKAASEVGVPIYIGAVLYEQVSGIDAETNWDKGFFTEAGDAADFFIVHSYFTNYNENTPAPTILNSATTVPNAIRTYLTKITTQYKIQMKPLALTEWNIQAIHSKQMCSYINGMHAALTLGQLANQGFGMAGRWDFANGYDNGDDMGMFNQGDEPGGSPKWNPRPCFFYMYFFQRFFGDRMVGTSVSGNSNVVAFASRFASGHAGVIVVNKDTTVETVELLPSQFKYGDRIYVYSLTGGTDNGNFSQQVFVNGQGPKYPIGGPIDTLLQISASAYSTTDVIKFPLPARSVQYVLIEPGTHVGVKDNRAIAMQFRLYQNYPNPFNPTTTISFELPHASLVTLKVFDALGREVATLQDQKGTNAGIHQVTFDASNLSSGVYFYRIQAGSFIQTNKMTLIK